MREPRGKNHFEGVCDERRGKVSESISQNRSTELRHNIEACVPARTTSPLLLSITNWMKRRASTPPALASAARCAAGRLARKTAGCVSAAMSGTPSIQEECALPACTNGLRPSASRVRDGRRIRIGMRSDLLIFALDGKDGTSSESEVRPRLRLGNKPRSAAKDETTDCWPAFRRAFDWQQRCRLR